MMSSAESEDAELVAPAVAGDRMAFAAIYDRYADRLYDFCASVLHDRDDAADAVQDTFVLAAERLCQLKDPQRLRPWLYAVARSVALRRVRDRKRYAPNIDVVERADPGPAPQQAAEQAALRELVWSAAAGLSDRDRVLLVLHLRHGLDGAELGEAMGVSANHAHVLLTRLRDQLERSLGALLIARLGRKDCTELDALLKNWDGTLTPLVRKRVARHVDKCHVCGERRRRAVSPAALLAALPLIPAPVFLRDRVLHRVDLVAHHGPDGPPGSGPVRPPEPERGRPPGPERGKPPGPERGKPPEPERGKPPEPERGKPPGPRRRRLLAAGAALVMVAGAGASVWAGTWSRTAPEIAVGAGPSPASISNVPSSAAAPGPGPGAEAAEVPSPSDPGVAAAPAPSEPGPVAAGPLTPPSSGPQVGTTPAPLPGPPAPRTTNRVPPRPPKPADTTRPVIAGQDASPNRIGLRGCTTDQARVYAQVTDDSRIDSVTLDWTDAGGRTGTVELIQAAESWRGTLGPFTRPGRVRWRLVATDVAGNTTTGSPADLMVTSCTAPPPASVRDR